MANQTTDLIIVGQGLAGSLLALHAIKHNLNIMVVSKPFPTSATFIAAGIMNPITGKRLVKTWPNESILNSSIQFYASIEHQLNASFLQSFTLKKTIRDPLSISKFHKKKNLPSYKNLLANFTETSDKLTFSMNPVFQINTPLLLKATQSYLQSKAMLIHDHLDPMEITKTNESITWKNIKSKKIIFCDGAHSEKNPFFQHIDWQHAKGHVIEFKDNQRCDQTITNTGEWCCPMGDQLFRYGSTTEWGTQFPTPTKTISESLLNKLKKHTDIKDNHTIQAIHSGYRPITKNRHPISGFLSDHPNIGCINGMGGNGTIVAPHLIQDMVNKLMNNVSHPLNAMKLLK